MVVEMTTQKDFVEVDSNGFVTKAEKTCFVLSYEDVADKLKRKITADEWEEICSSFEDSLQETNWDDLVDIAVEFADLAIDEDEDNE